eukprot:540375_1
MMFRKRKRQLKSCNDIWAIIRPGSNVSVIYIYLILLIINNYISFQLLYYVQYSILMFLIIICLFNFCYLSNSLISTAYCKPLMFNSFADTFKHYVCKIIIPFVMIPTFELLFRLITYKFRTLPDFYVFGGKKCGTTTLTRLLDELGCKGPFSILNHHITFNKETLYWLGFHGSLFSTKPKYFSMCFPFKIIHNIFMNKAKLYDATPDQLWLPFIHKRIHSLTPNTKIIIMIRHPIFRTKSHLQHNIFEANEAKNMSAQKIQKQLNIQEVINWYHNNDEIVNKYLDAMQKVDINDKVPDISPMLWEMPLIHRSMYYTNIQRLLQTFKREQVLIVDIEELNNNLYETLTKICKFINLNVNKKD